jgi:hypothetical protein
MPELPAKAALGLKTYAAPPPGERPNRDTNGRPGTSPGTASAGEGSSDLPPDFDEGPVIEAAPGDTASAPGESAWPISESAEASAQADARDRGEDQVIVKALVKAEEETVKKTLPPLDQLTPRIPEPVKEALEELFRARFTRVMRVKKRDIFNP